jgi:hypothetical protein
VPIQGADKHRGARRDRFTLREERRFAEVVKSAFLRLTADAPGDS